MARVPLRDLVRFIGAEEEPRFVLRAPENGQHDMQAAMHAHIRHLHDRGGMSFIWMRARIMRVCHAVRHKYHAIDLAIDPAYNVEKAAVPCGLKGWAPVCVCHAGEA